MCLILIAGVENNPVTHILNKMLPAFLLKWSKKLSVAFLKSLSIIPLNYQQFQRCQISILYLDRVKRIWYLSPMRAAKVQASLRIRAVSPEPSLLAHTSSESSGTLRQKARSLAPLNGWACAVKICHDGMLEDTNSLDGAHFILKTHNAVFL